MTTTPSTDPVAALLQATFDNEWRLRPVQECEAMIRDALAEARAAGRAEAVAEVEPIIEAASYHRDYRLACLAVLKALRESKPEAE